MWKKIKNHDYRYQIYQTNNCWEINLINQHNQKTEFRIVYGTDRIVSLFYFNKQQICLLKKRYSQRGSVRFVKMLNTYLETKLN